MMISEHLNNFFMSLFIIRNEAISKLVEIIEFSLVHFLFHLFSTGESIF